MDESRGSALFRLSIFCLLLSALHYRVSYTPADADLWGHVKFGMDIKESGRIVVAEDPYSYLTSGQLWINHEWLSEYAFALVYDALGTPGLVLLKTTIDLTIILVFFAILARNAEDIVRPAIVMVVLAFLLFYHVLTIRPHLFTYLFFLAELLILRKAETGRDRWLVFLPPLFALWVNLHGGFLAGLVVLFAWSAIHLLLIGRRRLLPAGPSPGMIGLGLIASGLACLVNPYGDRLLVLLLRTATVPRPEIVEWRSVAEAKYHFPVYLVLVAASLLALHVSRRPKRPALIVVYLMTAVLPLMAIRHLPLFAIGFVILSGEFLGDLRPSSPSPGARTRAAETLERAMTVVSLIAGVVFLAASLMNYSCIPIETRLVGPFPARAVAFLEKSSVAGNLVCHFNWGEYVIWHLGPRVKVSMDGRRETVYPEAIYDENSRFQQGADDWDEILRRPATDMVLVPNGAPPFNLLMLRSDWTRVYQDALCSLFVRRGSSLIKRLDGIEPVTLPVDGDGTCFP
jgi:hypothetical protein